MYHGNINVDTATGLVELKKRIAKADIPASSLDKSINIATWNIREFGKKSRLKQSLHYIAEVINQFDIVAITELRRDLSDLSYVMDLLGPYWKVVYSDYVADFGGNWERVAYVYDKRAVTFTGLAAEADAPRKKNKATGEYETLFSWWRKPYIASFRAGSFDFVLITSHVRWGKSLDSRKQALKLLAEWVDKRRKNQSSTDKDFIVMGDFNIPKVGDSLYKAITSKGLRAPEALLKLDHGTNLAKNKRYDQILHYPQYTSGFTDNAGTLDFYSGGIKKLYPNKDLTKTKFTYQMSDHLPLWIQMNIDSEMEKLDQIINR